MPEGHAEVVPHQAPQHGRQDDAAHHHRDGPVELAAAGKQAGQEEQVVARQEKGKEQAVFRENDQGHQGEAPVPDDVFGVEQKPEELLQI